MRKKVILTQFLSLLLLGVLVGVGVYFGGKKCTPLNQWLEPIGENNYQEFASRIAPSIKQLMHWNEKLGSFRFMNYELKTKWFLIVAVSVGLALLLAIYLALMMLIFVRKEEKTTQPAKPGKSKKAAKASAEKKSPEGTSDAVELLTFLQKEGRLIDFIQEDISSYDDAQVGAAARSIHANTKKALAKTVTLEPVMTASEGDPVQVEAGFDPSTIRLTGNVNGEPPFSGVLCHRGWKATNISIEKRPATHDSSIIESAEVEIG